MNPVRKRKLILILFVVSILAMVTGLVLYALRQNISLFYTPAQIANGEASGKQLIRLGGMVVKGSIVRASDDLSVQFELTDFKGKVTVNYRGILPDLFREGQGIVALGKLTDNQHFTAIEVLAKHDANYMPPEVKDALAKSNQNGERSTHDS
ncbi:MULTISPECIES: cytochrome c maturation protein CcmE [unclassified Legionella]|uniref:cytochrome c maturation protein CcmE n=1 Tax=unclassified Legionella TaxID=2622702 RepID=UPI001056DD86|nr:MULTISPECIES: cytochrome c maturation protein CcmE [unclassified Legionella]MDI9818586.1 cytochrome c maturation protein CcmE [Legionella sp. PL877]